MRFGFAPLYLSPDDVDDAITRIAEVMRAETWRRPEFQVRRAVT
jgi:kynureninase